MCHVKTQAVLVCRYTAGVFSITDISVQLSTLLGGHISVSPSGLPAQVGTNASGYTFPPDTVQQPPDNVQLLLEAARWLRRPAPSAEDSAAAFHHDNCPSRVGPPD